MSALKRKGKNTAKSVATKVPKLQPTSTSSDVISSPYFTATASTSTQNTKIDKFAASKCVPSTFYQQKCADLAKALLGKLLVHKLESGDRVSGVIVETESYLGREDKAAHSYKGQTEKNTAMFMDPGTAYVYNIYGMYCCMNISSQGNVDFNKVQYKTFSVTPALAQYRVER